VDGRAAIRRRPRRLELACEPELERSHFALADEIRLRDQIERRQLSR